MDPANGCDSSLYRLFDVGKEPTNALVPELTQFKINIHLNKAERSGEKARCYHRLKRIGSGRERRSAKPDPSWGIIDREGRQNIDRAE